MLNPVLSARNGFRENWLDDFVWCAMLCSSRSYHEVKSILALQQVGKAMLVDVLRDVLVAKTSKQDRVVQAASFVRWRFRFAMTMAIPLLSCRDLMVKYVLHGCRESLCVFILQKL